MPSRSAQSAASVADPADRQHWHGEGVRDQVAIARRRIASRRIPRHRRSCKPEPHVHSGQPAGTQLGPAVHQYKGITVERARNSSHNGYMSLAAACAQTAQVIAHAQSLFGYDTTPPDTAADSLSQAASSTVSAAARMTGLSGSAVDAHRDFVERAVPPLVGASRSDAQLAGHLQRAAAVVAAGASQLDGIAAENRQTTALAGGAKTPAAQTAVLRLLRSQVERTQRVVSGARQQASGIASGIQAVDYKSAPPLGPPPPAPGPPPPPLQNVPGPLQDFTKYQLNGVPIPPPPPPNVTADELRTRILQQNVDADKFFAWYNANMPKPTNFAAFLAALGGTAGSTAGLIATLPGLPEDAPLAALAASGVLGSLYALWGTMSPGPLPDMSQAPGGAGYTIPGF
jgi:hypothetical protein